MKRLALLGLLAAAALLPANAPAQAGGPGTPRLPRLGEGMFRVYAHSPAYNVGFTWEEGTLLWQGRTWRIAVEGLNVMDLSIEKLWVTGRITGLRRIEDLANPFDPGADPFHHNPDRVGVPLRNAAGAILRITDATTVMDEANRHRVDTTRLGVDLGGIELKVLP